MAQRKPRTPVDKLALKISAVIRASKCPEREIVNALMAVAAGRAVFSNTHENCAEFEEHAHTAFHSALAVRVDREKRGNLVN